MLGKLLKYDLRSIFKLWWVAAVSSVGLGVVGGIAFNIFTTLSYEAEPSMLQSIVMIFSILAVILSFFGMSAFIIASEVFIYVRYYKHLFTDEGYLTFTLPVKRRDILNSKLISGLAVNLATLTVFVSDILLFFSFGIGVDPILEIIDDLTQGLLPIIWKEANVLTLVYILELFVIILALAAAAYLTVAFCITFAATVAKKFKIFAAIGMYYLSNVLITFGSEVLVIIGSICLAGLLGGIQPAAIPSVIALLLFAAMLTVCAVAYMLYTLVLYLLDRKLNLS